MWLTKGLSRSLFEFCLWSGSLLEVLFRFVALIEISSLLQPPFRFSPGSP